MSKKKERESALEAAYQHMETMGAASARPSSDHITIEDLAVRSRKSKTTAGKWLSDRVLAGEYERVKSGSRFYYKAL